MRARHAFLLLFPLFGCNDSPSAPTANASAPPPIDRVELGPEAVLSDHREVSVRFPSRGVTLSGSLYLPLERGRYPAAVWVHGSGRQTRMTFETLWVRSYIEHGYAFLSFDKRGVGGSGGSCCPLDFPLLAADATAGVAAARAHPEIDPSAVGSPARARQDGSLPSPPPSRPTSGS